MSKLLSGTGVPAAAVFANAHGTPLYINLATGLAYFLTDAGVVTALAVGTHTHVIGDVTGLQTALDAKQGLAELTPSADVTIAALCFRYVTDFYEIASTKFLEIGDGAVMEVG